jgi:hypothetical protein
MGQNDRLLLQELHQKRHQLQLFRRASSEAMQALLDQYDWGIVSGAGQNGLPLLTLRLSHRISLDDPQLLNLAEEAEQTWGPVDFALFSGETHKPLRVLSQTLLDRRWRWRRPSR